MVFSSHIFVYYFLPFSLLVYYGLGKAPQRWKNLTLAILGYIFYGWSNPKFIFVMFGTTFLDWVLSMVIATNSCQLWNLPKELQTLPPGKPRTRLQRHALVTSVVSNLTMLAFFKYFHFGLENYNRTVALLGFGTELQIDTALRIVLPLGISFYTFQSLSYIIDVYRGEAKGMRSFIDFSCFVSMFPHLVAGPILKFSYLAQQIEHRTLTPEKFARGVTFFALGMGKKVILANPCGKMADLAFNAGSLHTLDAWGGILAYSFQIYFDFSGYADMAVGLGLMFGFVFTRNFDHPYRSGSLTEFWRRWHISLSTWLREYLYIPLGGNRKGSVRTYINLLLTMLLGGLWHGASWNYVIWGGFHGLMLCLEKRRQGNIPIGKTNRAFSIPTTFLFVLIAWVFFRASDLPHALAYLKSMFFLQTQPQPGAALLSGILWQPWHCLILATGSLIIWCAQDTWEFTKILSWKRSIIATLVLILALILLRTQDYNPFIYFIF